MGIKRIILIIGDILFLLMPVSVMGQDTLNSHNKVIVVTDTYFKALFIRLEAELQIAGFEVIEKKSAKPELIHLESLPEDINAYLYVQKMPKQNGSKNIYLYYRQLNNSIVHLEVPVPVSSEDEQLTALHIAEVLRVAFKDKYEKSDYLQKKSAVEKSLNSKDKGEVLSTQKFSDHLTSHFEPSVFWSDISIPPLFGLSAGFGMQWSWIGFSLTGLIPVSSININEPEADVKLRLGSAGASLCLVLGHGLVKPVLRLGYVLWISGAKVRGKESYSANSNLELTSGPQLFLGSAIGRKRISFTFGILLGMTASSLNYKIENRTVAKSGRPVLGISIGAALLSKQLKRGRK